MPTYYPIDETAARRAKEMSSFYDYNPALCPAADNRQRSPVAGHPAADTLTHHFVNNNTKIPYAYVLSRLQYWINAVHQDEQAILDRLSKSTMTEQAAASKRAAQEKRRAEKRLTELDNLLAKIYEDRVNEKITERNFSMLSQKYQQEQGELEKKIEALTAQLASTKEQEDGINKWVELIKQFSSPTELTADMLNTLIEKILVHEATKDEDGNRVQEIEIVYRFVGKID